MVRPVCGTASRPPTTTSAPTSRPSRAMNRPSPGTANSATGTARRWYSSTSATPGRPPATSSPPGTRGGGHYGSSRTSTSRTPPKPGCDSTVPNPCRRSGCLSERLMTWPPAVHLDVGQQPGRLPRRARRGRCHLASRARPVSTVESADGDRVTGDGHLLHGQRPGRRVLTISRLYDRAIRDRVPGAVTGAVDRTVADRGQRATPVRARGAERLEQASRRLGHHDAVRVHVREDLPTLYRNIGGPDAPRLCHRPPRPGP